MPDTPNAGTKAAYIQKLDELTRQVNRLEDEAVRHIVALLRETLEEIETRILTAEGWKLNNLTDLKGQVNDQIARFQDELSARYAGVQQQAYQIGVAVVDQPLSISGIALPPAVLSRNIVAVLQGFSADLIKNISDDLRTSINTTITQHLLGLSSPFAAMRQITQQLGVSDRLSDLTGVSARAEKIFRTETMRIYNISTAARQQQIAERVPDLMKVWVATGDHRTRRAHLLAHGQMVKVNELFTVGGEKLRYPLDPRGSAKNTINCILPGNEIRGRYIGGLRGFYSGQAIEFCSLQGNRLTVTPNHPILTPKGWVTANCINEGDQILSYCEGFEEGYSLSLSNFICENIDYRPALIENVFDVLAQSGLAVTNFPLAIDDLHGDMVGIKGDIDIIWPYWELPFNLDANVGKRLDDLSFIGEDVCESLVSRFSPGEFPFNWIDFTSPRVPSLFKLSPYENWVTLHSRPFKGFRFGTSPDLDSALDESSIQLISAKSGFFAELQHRLAGFVLQDQIVKVNNFDFSGHVYDFQSPDGIIIAQNIIISNCRCRPITWRAGYGAAVPRTTSKVEAEKERRKE